MHIHIYCICFYTSLSIFGFTYTDICITHTDIWIYLSNLLCFDIILDIVSFSFDVCLEWGAEQRIYQVLKPITVFAYYKYKADGESLSCQRVLDPTKHAFQLDAAQDDSKLPLHFTLPSLNNTLRKKAWKAAYWENHQSRGFHPRFVWFYCHQQLSTNISCTKATAPKKRTWKLNITSR